MGEFFARSTSHWDLSALTALELGSGCGLVGLTLHRLGMQRTILTDQLRMMRLLTKNMDANRLKGSSLEMFATEYVWGQMPEDQRIVRQSIDMVVASDCVYHESVAPMLVHTLVDVCKSRVDGEKCVGMVGQELRSDLVHQVFLAELLKHFVVYRVPVSPKIDGFYALYAIWLK
ncbi:hypothetical protein LPJ66_010355 [Kickxella alabastrina]|uniref:Uncharacterized protein n=1 Tax=Kickxella alabastrina TaxID=61397 RepID=A0ACC1I4W2_9FUNG|nr:hypothetical protein LPJ66_010355 [Kickxella alabastrina]